MTLPGTFGFLVAMHQKQVLVLPNGPVMAAAFLAVAAGATSAPLNPAYRANEFDFYLSDLNTKVLMVQLGIDPPAIAVAQKGSAVTSRPARDSTT